MRKHSSLFGLLYAVLFTSFAGMGTIDREPLKYSHPLRFEGTVHTIRGTRTAGPAPIPIDYYGTKRRKYGYSKHKAA